MSKYKSLSDFLGGRVPDTWAVSFEELEKALGFSLPKTAREKPAWWSNDDAAPKSHAKAWLDAGWAADADTTAGRVTFRRAGAKPAADPTAHEIMAAAEAEYEKGRAVDTAKKVGVAAAVVGVLAGIGLVVRTVLGRRK